jgi:hypothetical protein
VQITSIAQAPLETSQLLQQLLQHQRQSLPLQAERAQLLQPPPLQLLLQTKRPKTKATGCFREPLTNNFCSLAVFLNTLASIH